MSTYTVQDAIDGCSHGFVFVDFGSHRRIEPAAIAELHRFIRSEDRPAVTVCCNDEVVHQLDALHEMLGVREAFLSLDLNCLEPPPAGLATVLRRHPADVFFEGRVADDPVFLAALGAVERSHVKLPFPPESSPDVLRHLRRVVSLELGGLQRLDGPAAAALLEGNTVLRELQLPDLAHLDPVAGALLGKAGLRKLVLGPALQRSPGADGWIASPGLIQIEGLTHLTAAEAGRLAASVASCLTFTTPLDVSREAARHLATFAGTLSFRDLQEVPVSMAEGLTDWRRKLELQTLRLHPEAARRLRSDHGELDVSIRFRNGPLDEEAVIALASNGGRHRLRLELVHGHRLSERAATALARHQGPVDVAFSSVASLAAWRRLAARHGSIRIGDEVTPTEALARCLTLHRGPLELRLSRMPDERAATLFALHDGRDLALHVDGGEGSVTAAVADALARYEGRLTLGGITSLDAGAVQALSRRRRDLEVIPFDVTPELKAALAHLKAQGALAPPRGEVQEGLPS